MAVLIVQCLIITLSRMLTIIAVIFLYMVVRILLCSTTMLWRTRKILLAFLLYMDVWIPLRSIMTRLRTRITKAVLRLWKVVWINRRLIMMIMLMFSDSISCLFDANCITGPGFPYWLNDPCYALGNFSR